MTPALPLFHSFRNSFQSAMPWALRRSAVTGSSPPCGARGIRSSFKPASCGRRLPLRVSTCLLDHTRFSQASLPPRRSTQRDAQPNKLLPAQSRVSILLMSARLFMAKFEKLARVQCGVQLSDSIRMRSWFNLLNSSRDEWLEVAGKRVPLLMVRNDRARRYVLRLRPDGAARVTVPRGGSVSEARRFADRNLAWLGEQLRQLAVGPPTPKELAVGSGSVVPR